MSLLELIVALAIIAVVFLAIAGGQTSSFTSLRKSEKVKDVKTLAHAF